MEGSTGGLRERKKRAARAAIAAAARRLFAERSFDAVTVAEVAAAADVSEKTVFNHFATKEDLAFAGREERLRQLVAAVADRPAGVSVLAVFRAATDALIEELASADGDTRALARVVHGSRALQERLAAGWEDEAAAIAAAIAGDDEIVAAVVARALSWTHRTILAAALAGLHAGEDSGRLAARLGAQAQRAYDQLARGLRDYGSAG